MGVIQIKRLEKKYANNNQHDYIKNIINNKGHFIYITEDGNILKCNQRNNGFQKIAYIQGEEGKIENVQEANDSDYFIATSKSLYVLNEATGKVRLAVSHQSIKSIALAGDKVFIGLSAGVMIKSYNYLGLQYNKTDTFKINRKFLHVQSKDSVFLSILLRCRAILYDSSQNAVFAAFTDGLHKIKDGVASDVLYQNTPVYISSLIEWNNKIYAGTFNNGLFVITHNSIVKIDDESELPLDAIVKMKRCSNHLWIFRTHDIEVLDGSTDKFINVPPLPTDVADITDVDEDSANIYLATYHGLFTIPVNATSNIKKNDINLLYLLVNNKDTFYTDDLTLASNKNNLIFRLAIPVYKNADRLHFKYSLISGSGDTTWYYTQDAQREIQFNALKPGSYTFEAVAIKDDEIVSNAPLIYKFTIERPWFSTWWFYTCVLLTVISAALALQQYRLRQILKIERIRRKISNDLHDDIGSTLSSINVYSELAKRDDDNKEYVNTIQQNTVAIINNLDDLVWNINPKNDILENLVNRMRLFAEPLLTENNIECIFTVNAENIHITITPDLRTNIYLLFKEMINNVIKHSGCTICDIDVTQKGKLFGLTVKDNGRGFNQAVINRHRNGLHNMQQRTTDIKGKIIINSLPGSGTEITVTCALK
ncbi:MAG TPA: ATP-binding protein [Chitinophagaceae bacterium]|nr:ATP-binding protein [Chitinophagaceae bacterium]